MGLVTNRDWVADVHAFAEKFEQMIGHNNYTSSTFLSCGTGSLRIKLMLEEMAELVAAMYAGNLIEIADGGADLIYTALGTMVAYGIDLRPVWDEVHRSNMTKVGGGTRADGKILKPDGWVGPDIAGALERGKL